MPVYGKIILELIYQARCYKLIIAQSIIEKLPIFIADKIFDSYSITRLWS
jgi:PIN domain nuclease of toxin-antitoxin system